MTKLPAKFRAAVETEMRAFAQDFIKHYSEPPHGVLHHSYSLKPAMRSWALHHPFGAQDIVMFAESGSQEAHEVLTDLAAEEINEQRITMVLGDYAIRQLKASREPKKPGPTKVDNFRRDIGIALLVHALMQRFDLAAHHNPASRHPSASTVVAAALTEAGIGISFSHRGVAKVWDRFGPMLTGEFRAGYLGPLDLGPPWER